MMQRARGVRARAVDGPQYHGGGGGGAKTTATRNRSDVHDKFEAKRDMRHDLIAEAVELVRLANHEDVQRLA